MAKRRPWKRRSVTARTRRVRTRKRTAPAALSDDRSSSTLVPADITIVGVGASAGGLEAFTQLLEAVDADAGLTLVLVQHLSPHHESALPALLSAHTAMPVVQVTDGVRIERNHVYVIPPNVQMAVSGDLLQLSPRPDDRTAHTPIDSFFASLAGSARERAVAVVLSGTASDGAISVREIKAAALADGDGAR